MAKTSFESPRIGLNRPPEEMPKVVNTDSTGMGEIEPVCEFEVPISVVALEEFKHLD